MLGSWSDGMPVSSHTSQVSSWGILQQSYNHVAQNGDIPMPYDDSLSWNVTPGVTIGYRHKLCCC